MHYFLYLNCPSVDFGRVTGYLHEYGPLQNKQQNFLIYKSWKYEKTHSDNLGLLNHDIDIQLIKQHADTWYINATKARKWEITHVKRSYKIRQHPFHLCFKKTSESYMWKEFSCFYSVL